MNNKLLLLLIALSTLLAGCSASFTTMAKRPDGTSTVFVASESEIMDVTYDAISSQFPSDRIQKLPPQPMLGGQKPATPDQGYKWTHWIGLDTLNITVRLQRVAGDATDKVRIIGWAYTIDAASTKPDAPEVAIPRLVSALDYAFKHRSLQRVSARNVRFATEAEIKSANSIAVEQGSGTGFFVTTDGYLITNYHVIAEANRIDVHASNGNVYRAKVINKDPNNDVALLKVEAQTVPLSIDQTGSIQKGSEIFTLGYPLPYLQGHEVKATFGRVNALSGLADDIRFFQMDVPIQPGNSGGPLIDNNGAVVGIATQSASQQYVMDTADTLAQNVNYAVKSEYFITLLKYAKVNLPQVKPFHDAIKNPSQFEQSVAQVVVSQQVTP